VIDALLLSLEVALVATIIVAVVGGGLAVLLATKRFWGRNLLEALFTAPLVLPPTVLGWYLLGALGRHSAIGRAWEWLTGDPIVFTRTGAIVAASVGALPLVVRTARAALASVDPMLLGVSRTLGAGAWRTLWAVHIPLARRGLLAALLLAFARSLGDFGITLVVAGDMPGETQTASLFVYDAIAAGRNADAAGMVAILTAVGIFAAWLVGRLERGRE
jgi:molybdate transport system permease protein